MITDRLIRRNYFLLGAAVAAFYCMAVLATTIAPLAFTALTRDGTYAGVPAAVFLFSAAAFAYPASKAMDRIGRVPVIVTGFLVGAVGTGLISVSTVLASIWLCLAGFVFTGGSTAVIVLARVSGADMSAPERRGRGITLVMFGAVVGAILGPFVYMPWFSSSQLQLSNFSLPWLGAMACLIVGMMLASLVRLDPKQIALAISGEGTTVPHVATPWPLRQLLNTPGVLPILFAAVTCHALMVAWMSLMSVVMTEHNHHSDMSVLVAVGIHFLGMFGLVLVVGVLVDTLGYYASMVIGIGIVAASTIGLGMLHAIEAHFVGMFGLGIGWSITLVAATTKLTNMAAINNRARLLGLNDFLASLIGALLSLVGGVSLHHNGTGPLVIFSAVATSAAILFLGMARFSVLPAASHDQAN